MPTTTWMPTTTSGTVGFAIHVFVFAAEVATGTPKQISSRAEARYDDGCDVPYNSAGNTERDQEKRGKCSLTLIDIT